MSRRDTIAALLAEHEDEGLYSDAGGDTHYVCACDKTKRQGTHRAHVADVIDRALGQDEGVGTGAGEGAPRQDTGSAWVTRSADCPEAPAQAHPLSQDEPRQDEGGDREALDAALARCSECGHDWPSHVVDPPLGCVAPGCRCTATRTDAVLAWMRDQGFRRHPEGLAEHRAAVLAEVRDKIIGNRDEDEDGPEVTQGKPPRQSDRGVRCETGVSVNEALKEVVLDRLLDEGHGGVGMCDPELPLDSVAEEVAEARCWLGCEPRARRSPSGE